MTRGLIALAGLLIVGLQAQHRVGRSNIAVPVPSDPREPVTDQVRVPTTPERAAGLELLQRALQNSRLMYSGMSPYRIDVSFTAAGTGPGQLTQVWLSPQVWRWDASLGGVTVLRGATPEGAYADSESPVPMRIHELRNAIFSSMYDIAIGTHLRTATATVNGKPATCLLTSGVVGEPSYRGRLWEELEYCFDTATGRLVSSSVAPGVFTVYTYGSAQDFHDHTLPDHFTTYVAGNQVLDATVKISDAVGIDPASLAPTTAIAPRIAILEPPSRQPIQLPARGGISRISPVLVHANVVNGIVIDAEVCAAADPSLAPAALEAVKRMNSGARGQQQVYFAVKFLPPSN
jgi:hypothetical protein